MFCFDEINALYLKEVSWWGDSPAYQIGFFTTACNLSVTPFRNGFKLLSGTGHEQFFLKAQPGTNVGRVLHLKPWQKKDIQQLLTSQSLLMKFRVDIPTISDLVMSFIGTVPREVAELLRYIDFKRLSLYGDDPVKKLGTEILPAYEDYRGRLFFFLQINNSVKKEIDKILFCQNILASFLGIESRMSQSFLDLSVMYLEKNNGSYKPINPIAGRILANMLQIITTCLYILLPVN